MSFYGNPQRLIQVERKFGQIKDFREDMKRDVIYAQVMNSNEPIERELWARNANFRNWNSFKDAHPNEFISSWLVGDVLLTLEQYNARYYCIHEMTYLFEGRIVIKQIQGYKIKGIKGLFVKAKDMYI